MIDRNKLLEKVVSILNECEIRINVGGCGCCGSPWFSMEYKGELIVDEVEDFDINMIKSGI